MLDCIKKASAHEFTTHLVIADAISASRLGDSEMGVYILTPSSPLLLSLLKSMAFFAEAIAATASSFLTKESSEAGSDVAFRQRIALGELNAAFAAFYGYYDRLCRALQAQYYEELSETPPPQERARRGASDGDEAPSAGPGQPTIVPIVEVKIANSLAFSLVALRRDLQALEESVSELCERNCQEPPELP